MVRRYELLIIALFSAFAGLRVLVYAAAFPVFSQVDEDMHLIWCFTMPADKCRTGSTDSAPLG
jgi:hypothetical protein